MDTPVLEMKHIVKSFSGTTVLKDVDLTVRAGEVHGLMGENGAGKSTLIKILTGVYPMDSGEILIAGKKVAINSRQDARENGVSVIYQELSLIPSLTVTENIFLGQELTRHAIVQKKGMRRRVQELIDECHFDIHPDDIVAKLSVAKRQTVEILKALLMDAKIVVMDEPTASLTTKETETLFDLIGNLRSRGTSIIYISHRLEEVYRIVDCLTILRDGCVVGHLEKNEIDRVKVVKMMIGKEIGTTGSKEPAQPSEHASVLSVRHLKRRGILKDITFDAYGGQIVGIGGLVGSGRTELLRSIYGADSYDGGSVLLNGKPVSHNVQKNIRAGIGLIPEDRRVEGFIPALSVEQNIALPNYDMLQILRGFIDHKSVKKTCADMIAQIDIRPPVPGMRVLNLSGGNQQKVVVGKWLARDLNVLLVDEPTVGVDVGVKSEIYGIFRRLADRGTIVIVVSSDIKELISISDRILIFHGGRIAREFSRGNVTQKEILLAASGITAEESKAI